MRAILTHFTRFLLFLAFLVPSLAGTLGARPDRWIKPYKRAPLQSIVTWDNSSLLVNGKRIMFYSGEFHPFRLPVPGLWLDVFQKIRSMGYTGVSFYVDWALLEGKPGEFSAKGVFALEPFFEAAKQAGIYLLARPGPYINAEVSGGGFPGWLQRTKGHPRTADADYLAMTEVYVRSIGAIIAKAQITNGGPVILFQPENEYTGAAPGFKFPDPQYFQHVEDQFRKAGIVVPFVSNDASASGHNAPGQPAAVDIYGHDGYPLGFDCANPNLWPAGKLPTNWRDVHMQQSPNTPYTIPEFQGGSFDPWGGSGFEQCAALLNHEFQRVFYKNDFSFGVTIFNIYMTYGGTNWGNLGHAGGYTSYDYGAVISEERLVNREKYSEAKLEANFIVASPSYLTATPGVARNDSFFVSSRDLTVTPVESGLTKYLVVRHTDYASTATTRYRLTLTNTTSGDITVPLAGGSLYLHGRDSKIHVVDYMVGGINLLYSTAEILTWKKIRGRTILVVYSGPDEQHEMGVSLSAGTTLPTTVLGAGVNAAVVNGVTILSWRSAADDRALKLGPLYIYFIDRASAYQHWVLDVPHNNNNDSPYTNAGSSCIIVKGGYLMRTARISGNTLALTGDLEPTEQLSQPLRIIGGAPNKMTRLTFNGQELGFTQNSHGIVTAAVTYNEPSFSLPSLTDLPWSYIDSLPEIQPDYSDVKWVSADYPRTDNTFRNLTTPTSLYASEYGFHTGALLYRGHFKANGNESTLYLQTQGGSAFGMSVWLGSNFLGSFVGFDAAEINNKTFKVSALNANRDYVITVVIDNMGLNENWVVGADDMKRPRGILDFKLSGHSKRDVTWKLTGNLGGESFPDKARGPLNEGGIWAERQGFHLPAPPVSGWQKVKGGPMQGIGKAGIAFFTTSFELNMPRGYDIPLSIVFSNVTSSPMEAPPSGTSSSLPSPATSASEPPIPLSQGSTSVSSSPKPESPTVVPSTSSVTEASTPSVSMSSPSTISSNSISSLPISAPIISTSPLSIVTTPWDSPLSSQFGSIQPQSQSKSTPLPSSSTVSVFSTSSSVPTGTWPSLTRTDQRSGHSTIPLPTIPGESQSDLRTSNFATTTAPRLTSSTFLPRPETLIPLPSTVISTSTTQSSTSTRPSSTYSYPTSTYTWPRTPPSPTRPNQGPPRLTAPTRPGPSQTRPSSSYRSTSTRRPGSIPWPWETTRSTRSPSASPWTFSNFGIPPLYPQPVPQYAYPPLAPEDARGSPDFIQESPPYAQEGSQWPQEAPYFEDLERRPDLRNNLVVSPSLSSNTDAFSQIDHAEEEIPAEDSPTFPSFRVQIFVNGWQFGKYVSNIGPQTKFPVPEGIWNYHGTNWVSVTLWALDKTGARVEDIRLVAGPAILTGYKNVEVVESPKWTQRKDVY